MAVASDFQQAGIKALSAVNKISAVGGTDTTVSGNSTIATLIAAILALAPVAGAGPDANRQVTDGIQLALDAGLVDSSHGASTIAGLASGIQGRITDYSIASTYDSGFSE